MRSASRAALCVVPVLALAGCISDPDLRVRRLGNSAYLVSSDRCSPFGHEQLEHDIGGRAEQLCKHGVASLEDFRSRPSRQGSLLGECLRAGKLEARVTCHGKDAQP